MKEEKPLETQSYPDHPRIHSVRNLIVAFVAVALLADAPRMYWEYVLHGSPLGGRRGHMLADVCGEILGLCAGVYYLIRKTRR